MKILFLTQIFPYPLDAGPRTRAYYVIRHLAGAGHEVTLISLTRDPVRSDCIDHLAQHCRSVRVVRIPKSRYRDALMLLRSLVTGGPFLVERDRAAGMLEAVVEALRNDRFDAIHADQLWMAPYALLARPSATSARPPLLVLDQHNAVFNVPKRMAESESNPLTRLLMKLEAWKLARFERATCGRFDRLVWVTAEDRQALFPEGRIGDSSKTEEAVIPIALDSGTRAPLRRSGGGRRITFMGGLHWPPNVQGMHWFCDEIWPAIRRHAPDAILTIIGKDADRHFGARACDAVEVTGYVDDPIPYLADTAVFVVPLLAGGGMRVKIIDAWSWGLPVVSTTIGAEGIAVRQRENLWLADDAPAFASAVVDLFRNPDIAGKMAEAGRRTVESQYDWHRTYGAWDRVYQVQA